MSRTANIMPGTPQGYDPTTHAVVTGALGGAALGAAAGAVLPGVSILQGAVIGAAVGGLAGAVWADRNNDGRGGRICLQRPILCRCPVKCSSAAPDVGSAPDAERRARLTSFHQSQDFDGALIGEQVRRLRNSCTGPRAGALFCQDCARRRWRSARRGAALVVHAAPGACAGRTARRRPKRRRFLSCAEWRSAVACAHRRRCRRAAAVTLLGTASLDGLDPEKYHAAASPTGDRGRARRQTARMSRQRTVLCLMRSSLM